MANPFLDELELSVRAGNCLDRAGVDNIDKFMALEKPYVLTLKGAGNKTWREIREIQDHLHGQARRQSLPGRAMAHIQALNNMQEQLMLAGFFLRIDPRDRLRLARYVVREDFDEHG